MYQVYLLGNVYRHKKIKDCRYITTISTWQIIQFVIIMYQIIIKDTRYTYLDMKIKQNLYVLEKTNNNKKYNVSCCC